MKVVLDSNVVMAGFLWPGICTQFFDLANAGRIEPFTSRDLIDEIREVLHRPKHAHHVARTRTGLCIGRESGRDCDGRQGFDRIASVEWHSNPEPCRRTAMVDLKHMIDLAELFPNP